MTEPEERNEKRLNKKEQEQFLAEYKVLENRIRQDKSMSVVDYENTLNRSPEAERLQICRILRNYMVHREDSSSFLNFSQMTQFLHEENLKFASTSAFAEDVGVKLTPLTLRSTLKESSQSLSKRNLGYLPIVDAKNHILGILTPTLLIKCLSQSSRLSDKLGVHLTETALKKSLNQAHFCSRQTRLDSFAPNTKLVIVDEKGLYWKCVDWKKLG